MMHYSATPETDAVIEPRDLLLIDSGGQYLEGTTDITRTFALGPVTDEQKKHFTAVLCSMLNLANAKFLHGMTASAWISSRAARFGIWASTIAAARATASAT